MAAPRFGTHDVAIIGGGPAGLAAALVLGRSRRRVVLCDAGPPRNANAAAVHNFLTRDGTSPAALRAIAREQLAIYPTVELRSVRVREISGAREAFTLAFDDGSELVARRLVLAVGVVDELPDLPGLQDVWGTHAFQCPYCHGWEARDRTFGVLVRDPEMLKMALLAQSWTDRVVAFTGARFEVDRDHRDQLQARDITLVEVAEKSLVIDPRGALSAVELVDGRRVACEALIVRPVQRQTALVERAGVALDPAGYVSVDAYRQTSVPGIYAAGDLTTPVQAAILAAAAGMHAGAMVNHDLALA